MSPEIKAADTLGAFNLCASGSALTIKAAEGDGKLATFEGVAYTGAPMKPDGWWRSVIVDLDGVRIPSQHRPALRQHDHEQIVGHTTEVKASKKGVTVAGVLSGEKQHTDKVTIPANNGFQWQLSIGANPIRTENLEAGEETTVNGRTVTGPMTISRETEIGEISFVPLGADGETSAKVAAQKGSGMNAFQLALKQLMAELRAAGKIKAAKYSDADIDNMDVTKCRNALKECMKAADDDEDDEDDEDDDEDDKGKKSKSSKSAARFQAEASRILAGIRADAAKEHKRHAEIKAAVGKYNVTEQIEIEHEGKKIKCNLVAHAIEHDWTADQAELVALRSERPGKGVGIPGGLGYSTSAPMLTPEVLECAVLQAGRHQMKLEDAEFYRDEQTGMRRIPEYKEREIRDEFKARYSDQTRQAAQSIFKNQIALQQLMIAAARCNGYTGPERISDGNIEDVLRFGSNDGGRHGQIRAESSSTMSIANILANVQNKYALAGYMFTEQTWREISSIRPTNDFKPTKSINLLADSIVKQVPDDGELDSAALTDQAFANQADQFGRMLTIGRKSIINDDLGILTTAPMQMGRGAGLGLNAQFWTVFLNLLNINGDDGNAFWSNSSGKHGTTAPGGIQVQGNANYLSGSTSALSSAALQLAKQMFDNQVDPMGYPLGFDAVPVLLFPPELWQTAVELVDPSAIGIVYGGASASRQPNINLWKGRLKPVMSRYLNKTLTTYIPNVGNSSPTTVTGTTTAWWTLYPSVAGVNVIEVAFLNGTDTPTVQTAGPDWNFNRLGISMRVIFDYGVNQQNFRAGVMSAGA